jgi:hypothetical protein
LNKYDAKEKKIDEISDQYASDTFENESPKKNETKSIIESGNLNNTLLNNSS